MSATVNERFMDEQRKFAEGYPWVGGMMHVQPFKLLTHMEIYRFATRGTAKDDLYGAPWWFGVSAHGALLAFAEIGTRGLRHEARARLAVVSNKDENGMDLLVHAKILQPLSAWSGTPRTARRVAIVESLIAGNDYKTRRYTEDAREPDRSITQLYIPGLSPERPHEAPGEFIKWSKVLLEASPPLPV